MAKVVYHEARNQPIRSQLAIAEVIDNRSRSARFPHSYCAVANQRGQFFQTAAFQVPTTSPKWRTAVSVAAMVRARTQQAVTFGALFYHAASMDPHWPVRRERVAEIDGNLFYR
jgi:spore germination cell wall hydrolase CwlJ-like protein